MYKYLSFGEKIAKISAVDPEIIVLRVITKNKEIKQTKYTAQPRLAKKLINVRKLLNSNNTLLVTEKRCAVKYTAYSITVCASCVMVG